MRRPVNFTIRTPSERYEWLATTVKREARAWNERSVGLSDGALNPACPRYSLCRCSPDGAVRPLLLDGERYFEPALSRPLFVIERKTASLPKPVSSRRGPRPSWKGERHGRSSRIQKNRNRRPRSSTGCRGSLNKEPLVEDSIPWIDSFNGLTVARRVNWSRTSISRGRDRSREKGRTPSVSGKDC